MAGPADELQLTLILLCLNERETVVSLVEEAAAVLTATGLTWEIVVADGGSTDGGLDLLGRLAARESRLRIRVSSRPGYGRQLNDALGASRGARVIYMDADGQYSPRHLPRLLVTAPRTVISACRRGLPAGRLRRGVTRLLAGLARCLVGRDLGEVTAGCKCLPGDFARSLRLRWGLEFLGSTELMFTAAARGLVVRSVDYPCVPRPSGRSKLLSLSGLAAVIRDIGRLLRLPVLP